MKWRVSYYTPSLVKVKAKAAAKIYALEISFCNYCQISQFSSEIDVFLIKLQVTWLKWFNSRKKWLKTYFICWHRPQPSENLSNFSFCWIFIFHFFDNFFFSRKVTENRLAFNQTRKKTWWQLSSLSWSTRKRQQTWFWKV